MITFLETELPRLFLVLFQISMLPVIHVQQRLSGKPRLLTEECVMKILNIPTEVRSEKAKVVMRTPGLQGQWKLCKGPGVSLHLAVMRSSHPTSPHTHWGCIIGCLVKSQDFTAAHHYSWCLFREAVIENS